MTEWIPFASRSHFTAENLRKIIGRPRTHPHYVLGDNWIPPSTKALEVLAWTLNDITGAFNYAKDRAKQARQLRDAIEGAIEKGLITSIEVEFDHALLMPEHRNWRTLASVAFGAFAQAMQSTNPNVNFGLSSAGNPAIRFISAVVPMITGEPEPGADAVAKHLQRQRKKPTGTND